MNISAQVTNLAYVYACINFYTPSTWAIDGFVTEQRIPAKEFSGCIKKFVDNGWITPPHTSVFFNDSAFLTAEGFAAILKYVPLGLLKEHIEKCRKPGALRRTLDPAALLHQDIIVACAEFIQRKVPPSFADNPASHETWTSWCMKALPIIVGLFKFPKLRPLLNAFPKSVAEGLFYAGANFEEHYGYDPSSEAIRNYVLEKAGAANSSFKDWYLYHHDFKSYGRPKAVLAKIDPNTHWHALLSAVISMSENEEPSRAVAFMKLALDRVNSKRLFEGWFENWLYAIALFRDRKNAASLKKLTQIAGAKKIREDFMQSCFWMIAAVGTDMNARGSVRALWDLLQESGRKGEADQLMLPLAVPFAVTALNFKLFSDPTFIGKKALDWMDRFSIFNLEYAHATGNAAKVKELSRKYEINPLLPDFALKPEWEIFLDRMITESKTHRRSSESSGNGKLTPERLIYLIGQHGDDWIVTPRIQKRRANGEGWTKGAAVSLSSFQSRAAALTDVDRRVAETMVRLSPWTNDFRMNPEKALVQLVGASTVFDEKTMVPIEIEKKPLEITVAKNKNAYVFSTNLPEDFYPTEERRISIARTDPGHIVIIEPTSQERELIKNVRRMTFPAEARSKLTTFLEALSADTPVMSELLKDSTVLRKINAASDITLRIEPAGAGTYAATAVVHPVAEAPISCNPGEGLEYLAPKIKGEPVQIARDVKKEKEKFEACLEVLDGFEPYREGDFGWTLPVDSMLEFLETLREHEGVAHLEWPEGVKFRVSRPAIMSENLKLSLSRIDNWFEMEGKVKLDEKTMLTVGELLEKLKNAEGRFIRLSDNEYVALTESLRKELKLLEGFSSAGKKGKLRVSVFNAGVIGEMEKSGVEVDADEAFRSLEKRIREAKHITPEVPKTLRAELRPYQQEGFEWLSRLLSWGAGALLADDMGLGKTVQAIALLASRAKEGPQLVVMPAAVLYNWADELQRFAPGLRIRMLQQADDRTKLVDQAESGDVVLTTYGILASEIDALCDREWATVILDEAHNIKNRETKTSKAAMKLKSSARVLLTGTPLQNHLSEIWNLFEFANPGLLGSSQSFAERFIIPIERSKDRNAQRLLKRLISPFILRRTKAEVLDELPEKTEVTLRVELSDEERALYEGLRESASARLENGEINPIEALSELMKLRQAACAPELVNPKLKIESSKIKAFMKLADTLMEGGHRALVFSQFTSYLALLRKELDQKGIDYLYLDGATPAGQRQKLVDAFQKGEMPLFLISLKAGGTGLNLTAADYVAILDPWWNPAIESQASDRAYRIGQENPVTIYRLIAENTIEEKILRLHETKKSLADALLEGADMSSRLSKDEILKLLAAG